MLSLYIHIDCTGAVFPQCASWCAFWGLKDHCMNSRNVYTCVVSPRCEWGSASSNRLFEQMTYHIVCICAVSPQCEWGSESSNGYSEQMTCHTLGNCTSWPHCGSACDWKGHSFLQMSSDTRHKIIALTSSKITSYPLRVSAPIDGNRKRRNIGVDNFPFQKHQNYLQFHSNKIDQEFRRKLRFLVVGKALPTSKCIRTQVTRHLFQYVHVFLLFRLLIFYNCDKLTILNNQQLSHSQRMDLSGKYVRNI